MKDILLDRIKNAEVCSVGLKSNGNAVELFLCYVEVKLIEIP